MATPQSAYPQPKPNPAPLGTNGYPEKDVKTSGIVTRGNGTATRGKTARGPMA